MSKYFVRFNLGAGFMFWANGYTLSILHALRERYPEEMDIYYADVVIGHPKELEGEIKKLREHPKSKVSKELEKLKGWLSYKLEER